MNLNAETNNIYQKKLDASTNFSTPAHLRGLKASFYYFQTGRVQERAPGGARVRIAEKNLCYKPAFCFLITQMYAHF